MSKKRILFVDDEPNILNGLQRMLRRLRDHWDMAFVAGGREALEHLAEHPVDVIVSDIRMPEVDGIALLTEVRESYPRIVRIALSGYSDQEMLLRSVGPVHQFLAKPCDADELQETVVRACALRDLLADEKVQSIVSGISSLPAMPKVYEQVVKVLQSPDGSVGEVGHIISRDVAMTAKVLQLVNSAFFGLRNHVASPEQAVALLGMDTVKALVVGVGVFSQMDLRTLSGISVEDLSLHGTAVAHVANRIVLAEGAGTTLADNAMMAGMLHDVGILVFATNFTADYRKVLQIMEAEHIPLHDAEISVFGVSHSEVGAYLLGLWGLPDTIVEAVAYHLTPRLCPHQTFSVLTATHVANALVHEAYQDPLPERRPTVDEVYISQLQVMERLPEWRDCCPAVSQMTAPM